MTESAEKPHRLGTESERLLGIYLNDHLAGATLGVELTRRLRANNPAGEWATPLSRVCEEIEADRAILERIMERLQVRRGRFKRMSAWCLEKLGRLKSNGHLIRYSPLSRLVELEMLCIGITGKLQLWRTLSQTLDAQSEFDFDDLRQRASSQREIVEALHAKAGALAFSAIE